MSNRDLLVVAVLSGIGGVMSTYIGYLGNLLNRVLGVPFGAGQFVAGLHVFWLILAAGLVRRPGAATLAGLVKGIIEFLTGGTHGVAIILISLVQGLLVDLVLLLLRRYSLTALALAGAVATASNVVVFQLLYFSGAPWLYIGLIALLALVSGVILAGSFGYSVINIILQARPFQVEQDGQSEMVRRNPGRFNIILTMVLFLVFAAGAVYYFAQVYENPWGGPQCTVEGSVEEKLSFALDDFKEYETTIRAELQGDVTHVDEKDYTGIPLYIILEQAQPLEGAAAVQVMASDGYSADFSLSAVLQDEKMLLIQEDDMLRLIAGDYDGGYWVKQVTRIVVK